MMSSLASPMPSSGRRSVLLNVSIHTSRRLSFMIFMGTNASLNSSISSPGQTAQELQALLLMLTSKTYGPVVDVDEVNSQLGVLSFASEECITSLLGPKVQMVHIFHRSLDLSVDDPFL